MNQTHTKFCNKCNGTGVVANSEDSGWLTCPQCSGEGDVRDCDQCNGTGEIKDYDYIWHCPFCDGTGTIAI